MQHNGSVFSITYIAGQRKKEKRKRQWKIYFLFHKSYLFLLQLHRQSNHRCLWYVLFSLQSVNIFPLCGIFILYVLYHKHTSIVVAFVMIHHFLELYFSTFSFCDVHNSITTSHRIYREAAFSEIPHLTLFMRSYSSTTWAVYSS